MIMCVLLSKLIFIIYLRRLTCKQPLSITEFKLAEKCFPLAIGVVRAFMVLTPMSRFFKKAHGRIFRYRIKLWYSGIKKRSCFGGQPCRSYASLFITWYSPSFPIKDALLACRAFAFNSQVPPALLYLHHASVFMLSSFLRLVDFLLTMVFT